MRPSSLTAIVVCALMMQTPSAHAAGEVLRLDAQRDPWPQWQNKLVNLNDPGASAGVGLGNYLPLGSARWSGAHYFNWGRVSDAGGLRATGALLWPSAMQQQLDSNPFISPWWRQSSASSTSWTAHDPDAPSTPAAYVGLGYSAYWAKSGIGLSADLGLVSQRPSQLLQLGRGNESLWRSLQVSPMLQVNLSYAF